MVNRQWSNRPDETENQVPWFPTLQTLAGIIGRTGIKVHPSHSGQGRSWRLESQTAPWTVRRGAPARVGNRPDTPQATIMTEHEPTAQSNHDR